MVRLDPLCADCFNAYITTKMVKRMATSVFRRDTTRDEQETFLLPVSMGVSSVSLVQLLSSYQKHGKERTGKIQFNLHILHVSPESLIDDQKAKLFGALKQRFPEHEYTTIPLSSVLGHTNEGSAQNGTDNDPLHTLLNAIPSTTSRADILQILLVRTIAQFAKSQSIDLVLWADSTTRMAERVLSESAKGRGYSLPWQVTDGDTPYGVSFYFPLREVLKRELVQYVKLSEPPLGSLVEDSASSKAPAPASLRNSSIDLLMKQYFESAEEQYPSIVSNVVRTSTRLNVGIIGVRRCKLCTLPVTSSQLGIDSWAGIQETEAKSDKKLGLCYGCSRSVPAEAVPFLPLF